MVKSAFEIKKVLKKYKTVLHRDRIRVTKMLLYGSYARGAAGPYSDVDVVVISPDLKRFPVLKRQEYLAVKTIGLDAPLEVIGYTPQEFKKASRTVFGEILRKTGKRVV